MVIILTGFWFDEVAAILMQKSGKKDEMGKKD